MQWKQASGLMVVLAALAGSSLAFVAYDLPTYIYVAGYYAVLAIPIILYDGESAACLVPRSAHGPIVCDECQMRRRRSDKG
jgi:hypothetical protein